MSTLHPHPKGSARIYAVLLRLYPSRFRRRFGPQMLQLFQDSYPRAQRMLTAASLDFWRLTLLDLAYSLGGEWRQTLAKPRKLGLPNRQWADSLVIPFTVLGYLLVEGNLGAGLIRTPAVFPWVGACTDDWRFLLCMVSTGMAIAATLALLGVLSAIITARNRSAEIWSIKLEYPGTTD
jgi:hypothetical protein